MTPVCPALTSLALLAALSLSPVLTQPAWAQPPGYQVTAQDQNGIEIHFRGLPLRAAHADDRQNALSLDFQQPVDGAVFDRLASDLPGWISMAYANFDNGVIRATRPATFLTRTEADGFSLRIVARAPQSAQNSPLPPPPAMRGGYTEQQQPYPPPQPQPYVPPQAAYAGFHTYGDYAALRAYEAQELAIRRADPMWALAYGRAAMQSDSAITVSNETNWYHGGDLMIATDLAGKISVAPGIAFVGDVKWSNVTGRTVRMPAGAIAANSATDLVTGVGGLAFELGRDSELRLQASEGNNVTGGHISLYSGEPGGFGYIKLDYHTPWLDTPTAVANRADVDTASAGYTQQLGWGVWGSVAGHYTRYGVHGDADVARTAGWDASLRWNTDVWDGLLAGLSYDGHGEYRSDFDTRIGAAPSPYVPLGIRSIENHAVATNLTGHLGADLWFSAYAGWVVDRYASDGLLAGLDLHYTPAPGVDVALGVRQSAVSYTQGESGRQTTAGLNMTLGFGAPPQPSWMLNSLTPSL